MKLIDGTSLCSAKMSIELYARRLKLLLCLRYNKARHKLGKNFKRGLDCELMRPKFSYKGGLEKGARPYPKPIPFV